MSNCPVRYQIIYNKIKLLPEAVNESKDLLGPFIVGPLAWSLPVVYVNGHLKNYDFTIVETYVIP